MKCGRFVGHHLPTDVIFSILAQLPVKSLFRFRCVCKEWTRLVNDPYFISMHNLAHEDRLNYLVSDDERRYVYSWNKAAASLKKSKVPLLLATYLKQTGVDLTATIFHGSCNGLVCLSGVESSVGLKRRRQRESDLEYYIWNPSVKKIKKVGHFSRDRHVSGFGLSKNGEECKLVKISLRNVTMMNYYSPSAINVYSTSTNSWKLIRDIDDYAKDVVFKSQSNYHIPSFVCLNGSMHWLGDDKRRASSSRTKLILSFDLQSEVLQQIVLPKSCGDFDGRDSSSYYSYIGKHQKRISLMAYTRWKISIWIMNEYGVEDSWTQLYNYDTKEISIPVYLGNLGFVVKMRKDGLLMFDFEDQRWINIEEDIDTSLFICSVIDYTDSLLLP